MPAKRRADRRLRSRFRLTPERLEDRRMLADFTAVSAGGPSFDTGFGLAALPDGGTIVVGRFTGTAAFGPTTVTSAGDMDAFVARLNADGSWAWVTRAGGSGADEGLQVVALADGSAILTGTFHGTAAFGGTTLTADGIFADVFVAKVTAQGAFAWATRGGGDDYDQPTGLAALADDSVVLVGSFRGTATFGGTTLASAGMADMFVCRVDAAGSFAWAARAGGAAFDLARGVAALPDGAVLVAGEFRETATLGGTTLTSRGDRDLLVARVNADGSFGHVGQLGGEHDDADVRISVVPDGSGAAILAANSTGSVTVGGTTFAAGGSWLARIAVAGAVDWAAGLGATPAGLAAAADGSVVATGSFSGSVDFGATRLVSEGPSDVFVAKVSADGGIAWATRAGGVSFDAGGGIALRSDGSAVIAGSVGSYSYDRTASFGGRILSIAGESDVFVARVLPDGRFTRPPAAPAAVIGFPGDGQVSLSWTLPADDGGAAITDHVVEFSDDSGSTWQVFADGVSAAAAVTVTGLVNGTPHLFRVQAVSAAGVGAVAASGAVTPRRIGSWATDVGGRAGAWDETHGNAVATLPDGSAVVVGSFFGQATFGDTTLAGAGSYDAFIARLNADGSFAWAIRAGGADADGGSDVALLADGSAVVTGSFSGTATFGGTTLTSAGGTDIFVAKVLADGSFAWAVRAGGTDAEEESGLGVAVLADGSAIVTGAFYGTATFGATTLRGGFAQAAFVAKLDPTGAFVWALCPSGPVHAGMTIAPLADGSVLVGGAFYVTATFGSTTLTNPAGQGGFVARVAATGAFVWARTVGTEVVDVGALADGSALAVGAFDANVPASRGNLAKLAADGSVAWVTTIGSAAQGGAGLNGVSVLTDGSALVTGGISHPTSFGDVTITPGGQGEAIVARVTPGGSVDWVVRTSTSGENGCEGGSIAAFADGTAVVIGSFQGGFRGGAGLGEFPFARLSDDNLFVARVGNDLIPAAPADVVAVPGNRQATVSWAPRPASAAPAIIDYVVHVSGDGGATWTRFDDGVSTATSATVTGLVNDRPYRFRVSAVNVAAQGSPSGFSAAVTPVAPVPLPPAPTGVSGIPGDAEVALQWETPAIDDIAAISDYVIEVSDDAGGTWTAFEDGVTPATTVTVTGLANFTPHLFRVAAVNVAGRGSFSAPSPPLVPFTNRAPTGITLSATSVAENLPSGTVVGSLSTTDLDAGDVFTYELVTPGTESGFQLVGADLQTTALLDFERGAARAVRVRTTDGGGLSFERSFTLTVTDVNEAPTLVSLTPSAASLPENTSTAAARRLAEILVTDDALGTNLLGLAGPDAESFQITGRELFLREGVVLDHEARGRFSVVVTVGDGSVAGSTPVSAPFSLTVTDLAEPQAAPQLTLPAAVEVVEDTVTALVFTVPPLTDADSPATKPVTLRLAVPAGAIAATATGDVAVGGTPTARTLSGSIAALNAFLTASPARVSYMPVADSSVSQTLTVTVTEAYGATQLSSSRTVSLLGRAVNDAPTVTAPAGFRVTEDVRGTLVWPARGTPFADIDSAALVVTLSVADGVLTGAAAPGVAVGGTPVARTFSGTPAALNAYFKTLGRIAYTTAPDNTAPRTLTVSVSDGLLSAQVASTITITPVNDAPRLRGSATLPGGPANAPVELTHEALRTALGAADADGAVPTLVIQGVTGGTLQRWSGTAWVAVPTRPDAPLAQRSLAPGQRLRWLPPRNATGARPAFRVQAWDGRLFSAATAQVFVQVQA